MTAFLVGLVIGLIVGFVAAVALENFFDDGEPPRFV